MWRSYLTVRIRNRDIAVRRNTNDSRVAIENIVEDFKVLEKILPPNLNGNFLEDIIDLPSQLVVKSS